MTLITIRQTGEPDAAGRYPGEVSFDGQAGFPVTVADPFAPAEEAQLAWYFEEHLRFPFTDQVRAQTAAASVRRYGTALFAQILRGHDQIYARYRQAVAQGVPTLRLQVVGGPDFHQLHWEALCDPDRPRPLVLDAALVRSTQQPVVHSFSVQPSPTINLLLVTARPQGGRDVGYRTIQRPLVETLRQSQLPVQIDMVRPGTYRALVDHLQRVRQQRGVGHYHIIHFDLHGAVLSRAALEQLGRVSPHSYKVRPQARYARPDLAQTGDAQRLAAWLFFEDEAGDDLDAASAEEVAGLLLDHQIPIAILNACQSGQETGDPETGLGSRLLQAGVQTVVAMSYSVTVSAATRLMTALYGQLFAAPHDLLLALSAGRTALHHTKQRSAYFNQQISLEDWLLPVLYQPGPTTPSTLPLRAMTFDEQIAFFARDAARYPPPAPTYGFVGRDLDILQIEKRLLRTSAGQRHNLLLIQGMGGAGKSTLLHHLAWWWQRTGLVDEVFYFGYDERAHTLQQILDAVARRLLNRNVPAGAVVTQEFATFQAMQLPVQARLLAQKLRSERHLLILDNLESVTGDPLAIAHTLPLTEQAALRSWLADLLDGQTLVLLGSRGEAAWLQAGANAPLRAHDVYALPGLDAAAATDLAERILLRQVTATQTQAVYRASPALRQLLKLLDGSPLALEVVLSNLARQTPEEILQALQAGDVALDRPGDGRDKETRRQGEGEIGDKTRSILACIAYAHSNLDAAAQRLLLCLFPFTGVIWADQLTNYANHLVSLSPTLPVSQFSAVLHTAQEWGLLTPHEIEGYLRLQPVLPYFLKTRLAQEPAEVRAAIETAFRLHYADLAKALFNAFEAKEAQQRQTARHLTGVEYENLTTALQRCLVDRVPFFDLYAVLGLYLNSVQDHHRGIELGKSILAQMEQYSPETRFGTAASGFLRVLGDLGSRQMKLKRYGDAAASYQAATQLIDQITNADAKQKANWKATVYHQLGVVAEEQRQWTQAEQHYQHALAIYIEFNDRYEQAGTYHQLGMVAQEQRQWAQAEQHYQQALALKIEFNDRYRQASTYHQLGMVAQEQRQWAQAEQHYQQALALFIEFNDRYSQASTYGQLGRVAEEQRQWAQAEQHYQHALALWIEFNDRYSQALTYHQLGSVAQEQRQWTQAEQHYQQALALFIEFNDRYSQASTYHQLGNVAQEQRQWAQAEQHYQQALALKIEFNDRYSQALTLHSLGAVAQEQREFQQAEEYLQQAIERYIEFGERYWLGGAYHQLGRVAEEQEQWQSAYDYFVRALTTYVEFKDDHYLGIVQRSLRRLWQAHPDEAALTTIAGVLGVAVAAVRGWLTTTDSGSNG